MLAIVARAKKLVAFAETMLARRIDDAASVARLTGTSVGKAKGVVETGKALGNADEVRSAFQGGEISLDQAAEIAKAEDALPGVSAELLSLAGRESFQVLREQARKVVLEVEQHRGLGARQREARSARTYPDELGMIHVHLAFEPHVGTRIVNRAEAEAQRLQRAAKKAGEPEPFERYLADAYAEMLAGSTSGKKPPRPELVMVVSHEVAKRGWTDVREGEVCKIPGVGPVSPQVAKEIASDAFLTGLFFDGKDLRQMKRWTPSRHIPVEVRLALELGDPPEFDGMKCADCGSRFRNERDHVEPHTAHGPASIRNMKPRCRPCHEAKTARDFRAGKFKKRIDDG